MGKDVLKIARLNYELKWMTRSILLSILLLISTIIGGIGILVKILIYIALLDKKHQLWEYF